DGGTGGVAPDFEALGGAVGAAVADEDGLPAAGLGVEERPDLPQRLGQRRPGVVSREDQADLGAGAHTPSPWLAGGRGGTAWALCGGAGESAPPPGGAPSPPTGGPYYFD